MTKKQAAQFLGGLGGSSKSEAKRKASAKSLAKARKSRWPEKIEPDYSKRNH